MAAMIELGDVSKTYRLGETRVRGVERVCLRVDRGELVAVTGPSGSGKSTLLNLCGLVDTPDSGTLSLEGREVGRLAPRELTMTRRRAIGYILQGFNLIPVMTAFENVEYPLFLAGLRPAERRRRTAAMLDRVGLGDCGGHRPDRLSGGQRQRVAVARALVKRPAIVLADEPTANLDTETATRVLDLMRDLARESGSTFLVATHDARMTGRCDRALVLVDGRLR